MKFFIIGVLGFSPPAAAEYRAFLLQITNPKAPSEEVPPQGGSEKEDSRGKTSASRLVKSNLDPLQYRIYYPLQQGEQIVYIDTWLCQGNTGNKPICPSPKSKMIQENQDKEREPSAQSPENQGK